MKRKIAALLILISCMASSIGAYASEVETETVVVTGDNVRLRYDGSFDGDVYCEVPAGTFLEKINTNGEWTKVIFNDQILHVHSSYIVENNTETILNYNKTYYGKKRITAYCHCRKCTGSDDIGHTSSGTIPTAGRTVANNVLKAGTKVMINNHIYTVEDTGGAVGDSFDIYFNTHEEALNSGYGGYWDVWIINE